MREVKNLVVHCLATPNGKMQGFGVEDIDKWHIERGFKRQDSYRAAFNPTLKAIGYHFVIYCDGSIHTGRQVAEAGAQCVGCNDDGIGIALQGTDKYTQAQFDSLKDLLQNLQRSYPKAKISGHYQWPSAVQQKKSCPNIDIPQYLQNNMTPDAKNLLTT